MENRKTIFDLLLIFAQQKKVIIWITLAVAVAAVTFSLVTPQIWTSKTTFKPDASSSLGMSLNIPGLSGIMSSLIGGSSGDAQSALAILRSRTLNEDVIRRFELIQYFEIDVADTLMAMDLALKKLKDKVFKAALNEENGLISIYVSTKDKMLSKKMADSYLAELDKYNREYKLTKGKRNRKFFESRVAEVRHDIDSLSIAIRNFQKKNKYIDINSQSSSIISLYSDVISQQMIADMELAIARQNYNSESPIVKNLIQKQILISNKIKELENSSDPLKPGYLIDIDKIPDVAQQYTQIMINLEIKKKVFEYLYPQFEAAKLEELKDIPTIEVIDYPKLAGFRSSPRRGRFCIITTFLGFIFALGLAYIKHRMDQNRQIIKQIWEALFKKKTTKNTDK